MLALVTPQGSIAETVQNKAEALKARFFLKAEADLLDINETSFQEGSFSSNPIELSCQATREEVEAILRTRKPFWAPGIDSVPNGFL